ncbi:ABC transporter ATP-binding protein [Flavobacterium psychraquaticum]|uniref:ABC transporter ATP-binding protein n=1 Tax=Flavobacterium psychraquaticum TaxID=3103958 RepID=UPI002ACD2146|nr:ABC transporter ATP-binding protein [Flavobacterium sp. LB-N7T]
MSATTNHTSSLTSEVPILREEEAIIQVENLTKTFGDFTAVKGITFDVYKGEIFGFLGANGAGKTTAMKMLIGISKPTSGKAIVARLNVATQADLVKKSIGYMSQKFSLYDDLTVKENITFFGGIYGLSRKQIKEKITQLITELEMQNVVNNLVSSLPLGWKQKLSFSIALLHDPKIVFLDEPTGGVDPITRRQFWEMIYTQAYKGTTIFVTTHYMDEAEYCDRVSIMVEGVIEALDTPKNLKKQFNVDSMNDVFLKLARNVEAP